MEILPSSCFHLRDTFITLRPVLISVCRGWTRNPAETLNRDISFSVPCIPAKSYIFNRVVLCRPLWPCGIVSGALILSLQNNELPFSCMGLSQASVSGGCYSQHGPFHRLVCVFPLHIYRRSPRSHLSAIPGASHRSDNLLLPLWGKGAKNPCWRAALISCSSFFPKRGVSTWRGQPATTH